jgi:hypothetical protein
MSRGKHWNVLEPTRIPTEIDIAWAAGFLEGDGYFGRNLTTSTVEATQKEIEPLKQLQELFGGSLGEIHRQGINKTTYFRWRVSGQKAMALANDMFKYMSPKRKNQINTSFDLGEKP